MEGPLPAGVQDAIVHPGGVFDGGSDGPASSPTLTPHLYFFPPGNGRPSYDHRLSLLKGCSYPHPSPPTTCSTPQDHQDIQGRSWQVSARSPLRSVPRWKRSGKSQPGLAFGLYSGTSWNGLSRLSVGERGSPCYKTGFAKCILCRKADYYPGSNNHRSTAPPPLAP